MSPHTRYVENIDQFCDRWCAKCPATARCEAFARTRRDPLREASDEIDDPQALKNLRAFVVLAVQALHSMAGSEVPAAPASGLTPLAPAPSAPHPESGRALGPGVPGTPSSSPPAAHPVILGVLGYLHSVRGWFDEEQAWLRDKRRSFRTLAAVSADPASALTEAEALVDALEIVAWDVALIPERVEHALDAAPADSRSADGHAKVALLSIDRSVDAWLAIRRARRGVPDTVIPLLHQLAQLREQLEAVFPHARRFARPGFDASRAGAAAWFLPGARP